MDNKPKNHERINSQIQRLIIFMVMVILMLALTAKLDVLDDFVGGITGSLVIIIGRELLNYTPNQ